MRIELTSETITMDEAISKFLLRKRAGVLRDRTLKDYQKELGKFAAIVNTFDEKELRKAVLNYFSAIPNTSAAIYNRPYIALNCFFNWCVDQEYLIYNTIAKEKLKKRKDDSNIESASIDDVKRLLKVCSREITL